MMNVCFMTGNRDAPETLFPAIRTAIADMVRTKGCVVFATGGRGRFEGMAARAVMEVRTEYPAVKLCLLLAYHPAQRKAQLPEGYDESFFPLEKMVPARVAIVSVNRYMIDHCAACIIYAAYPGNSRRLLDNARIRAQKGQVHLVDLSET